jgi:hypothetical protein
MGYKITIKPETICNKYSRALTLTNVQLVTTVVTGAFTQLVAPTSPLLGFFDGTYNAVNYTNPANAAATTNLANHLVQFFGAALGCTDPSYPPYTGNTDLHAVHIALPIGSFEFSAFNNIVIGVMAGAGVSQADQTATLAVLNTLQPDICNIAADCKNSICDRYSKLLNITNVQLVTTVVQNFLVAALTPGFPLKGFFDGSIPVGSTNFSANAAAATRLGGCLVAFFGQQGVLTCTDASFPPYTCRTDLHAIHQLMPIGINEFNTFNTGLLGILAAAGVAQADQNAVLAVLQTTKSAICNQPNCGGAPPATQFAVDVVIKTAAHPQFMVGFTSGFRIDGEEGRELFLQPAQSYSFLCAQSCVHPMYITTDVAGASASPVTTGVTFANGDPLGCCNGGMLTFTPTQGQVGSLFYYNCQIHMNMGWKIHVGATPTQVTTGVITIVNTNPVTTGVRLTSGAAASSTGSTQAVTSSGATVVPTVFLALLFAIVCLF